MLLNAVLLLVLIVLGTAEATLVHTTARRSIDLGTHGSRVVREQLRVRVQNTGTESVAEYRFVVPSARASKLAWIAAETVGDSASAEKQRLAVVPGPHDGSSFSFQLSPPLAPGAATTLDINQVYMDDLVARPAAITQGEPQRLEFRGSLVADVAQLPYATRELEVVVNLPLAIPPISHSTAPIKPTVSYNTLTYGPITDLRAVGDAPLVVHFDSPKSGLVVDTWQRQVWVRYGGSAVEVEEAVKVVHDGARLKGHFSRVDYVYNQHTQHLSQVIPKLPLPIPHSAHSVYYYDTIGNVSTSTVVDDPRLPAMKMLHLQPRYPLVGGWEYSWTHGYGLPGTDMVQPSSNGQSEVHVPLVHLIPGVAVRSLELRVVLPEGARDISVHDSVTGAALDDFSVDTTWYYLDTTGRPTVVIRRTNVVDEAAATVLVVRYSRSAFAAAQKPLAVVAAIAVLVAVRWVVSLVDLSVGPTMKGRKTVAVSRR
ncbi:Ribophorin I [Blastocladiella britannica]|nr:Ribophorin I [Blastocladiella britannica]